MHPHRWAARRCGGSGWKGLRIEQVTRHLHAIMFIESRILRPHVRRPEARWPDRCATHFGRHEGCHASSRDEGDTVTEAVTGGTVGKGAQ
jgi:hypothetical protein